MRGLNVAAVWAIESKLGRKMDWRDAVVTTWGGLRGAVGLALALIVFYDDMAICVRVRDRVLFHCSGIVILTVVVNSMTMRKVIGLLGINEETEEKALMQRQDDTEEALKSRLDGYHSQTVPILAHYEPSGAVYRIDANQAPPSVWASIAESLKMC